MTDDDELEGLLARVRTAPSPLADGTRAQVLAAVLADAPGPTAVAHAVPLDDATSIPIERAARRRRVAIAIAAAMVAVAAAAAVALWPRAATPSERFATAGRPPPAERTLAGVSAPPAVASTPPDQPAVVRRLLALGYLELFQRADDREATALVRAHAATLHHVIGDPMVDPHARFLAAELLFAHQPGFSPSALGPALADVYARAIGHTHGALATGGWVAGNAWGLLYDLEDVGPSGRHLLALGEAAIPALLGLIDRTEVVLYEGSEEATIGNDRAYRVKDVAAYFVARLSGRPLGFHPDPAARDRAIEVLVAAVGAR
jgi:hypothetical protein